MGGEERTMDGGDGDFGRTPRKVDGEMAGEGSVRARVYTLLNQIAKGLEQPPRERESPEEERERICAEMEHFDSSALGILSQVLDSGNVTVRIAATKCLGCFGEQALDDLDRALEDEDWRVRGVAVGGLGWIGVPALSALGRAAEDPNERVRLTAIRAMGYIGEPALDALTQVLSSEDWGTRRAVVQQLGRIGEPAMEALAGALRDPNGDVADSAVEQFHWIREPALDTLMRVLEDEDEDVRVRAVRILGGIGDPALDALTSATEDESGRVRWMAIEWLMAWDNPPAHVIVRALEDPKPEISDVLSKWLADQRRGFGCNVEAYDLVQAVVDELILRLSGKPSEYFSAEATARALEGGIVRNRRLRGEILETLCDIAYAESGAVRERAVAVARILGSAEFAQLVKNRSVDQPDTAAIMRSLGGGEAAAFFSELQSMSLAEYRAPLVGLEEVSRERWEELTDEARRSAKKSDWMSVSVFVVGTAVVITAVALLVLSDEPWQQFAAALSGLGTFLALYGRQFWKEPVEQIQRFSAQQARLQVAFIGYMNRISQLRLVFEGAYAEDKISLEELQEYQKLMRDATEQAWSQLAGGEQGTGSAPGPTQLPAGEQPGTGG